MTASGARRATVALVVTAAVAAGGAAGGVGAAGCRGRGPGPALAPAAATRAATDSGPRSARAGRRRFGGARPATVLAPAAPAGPLPLVLVLHGYGDTGLDLAAHLGYLALARRTPLVLVVPDGTRDRRGDRFWNATAACCDFERTGVDDVAYLEALLAEVRGAYPVDPGRIYAVGLSNGGFMAHRLACAGAADLAAIVSIAGVPPQEPAACRPPRPVSVLQVHADSDRTVAYAGGRDLLGHGGAAYPGARATVARWATLDGCPGPLAPAGTDLDLDDSVPGAETTVEAVGACPRGVGVALWTMRGAAHVPAFGAAFAPRSFAWLQAHARVPAAAPAPASASRRSPPAGGAR